MEYQYDEELKIYSKFKFNIQSEWLVSKLNVFLFTPMSLFTRDDIDVKVLKFKNFEAYELTPKHLKTNMPCMFFIHGGGFVMEGASYHYDYAIEYAKQVECKVFYIKYRLAPKHPYPAGLLDCFHLLKYVLKNHQKLGIDKNKIGFVGDSAGGNLAAALTLLSKERLNFIPKFQVLIYPVIDMNDDYSSQKLYDDTPNWNRKMNRLMWKAYIKDDTPLQYASLFKNHTIMQVNTYIETAQYDCLHDEAIAYANHLKKMGCEVFVNETIGTFHGYDMYEHLKISKEAMKTRILYMKKHFR